MLCNSRPEAELVRRLFGLPETAVLAVGVGLETAVGGDAARFRASHAIEAPFLLYIGRHDHGKKLWALYILYAVAARRTAPAGAIEMPAAVVAH